MSGVDGLSNARVLPLVEEPTILVEVDLTAAETYGIKAGDVRRAAATLISGIEVGSLFEDQKVFEVVVWGVPELRQSLEAVQGLMIDRPDGGQVALGEVADVRIASAPAVINRDAVARYVDVAADLEWTRCRLCRPRRRERPRHHPLRLGVPRGSHGERACSGGGADDPPGGLGRRPHRDVPADPGRRAELEAGDARVPRPPERLAGGIAAGLVTGELLSIGALVGLLRSPRPRRPQWPRAAPPLPTSGSGARRGPRPRDRPHRRQAMRSSRRS